MSEEGEFRPRLFIGGLKGPVEKEDLQEAFAPFGNVIDVWVAYDPPGFAFVEYDDMEAAKQAKEKMNNTEVFDTTIRVELTRFKKGARHVGSKNLGEAGDKPRLFVGGIKGDLEDDQLKEFFEEIGPVTDVFVAKGKGYAFVEFGSMAHAKRALTECDQSEHFGFKIRCEMSQSKGGGGGGGRGGRGRGRGRGRGGAGGRSAPYPPRGGARPPARRPPPASYYDEDPYYGAPADPYYDDPYARAPRDPYARRPAPAPVAADPYADPYAARRPYPPAPRDPYYASDPYYATAAPAAPAPVAADPYAPVPAAPVDPRVPAADPYYRRDPYAARPPADPYARPAADPYARLAADPYAASAADPYAVEDPYAAV